MKYNKKTVITIANERGSSASTVAGAIRYCAAHPRPRPLWDAKPLLDHRRAPRCFGETPRSAYHAAKHRRRLCDRYVGLSRFPRHLSADDRATIAGHPANAELRDLMTIPAYARAFYAKHTRTIRRLAPTVARWDAARGTIVKWTSIAQDAYRHADFGRKKNTDTGSSCMSPGVRTTSYQRGRNPWGGKWTHYTYHADYTLIAPRKHGKTWTMYYVRPDGTRHIVYVSPHHYRIDCGAIQMRMPKKTETNALPAHIQRRILAAHTPSLLTIGYDREAKKLTLTDRAGEIYHLLHVSDGSTALRQVNEALAAFRKRRAEKISVEHPERVWVTIMDSHKSGNCRAETTRFADRMLAQIDAGGVDVGDDGTLYVRGDVILAARNDSFTRRAVSFAAARIS